MQRPLSGADRGLPSGAGLVHNHDRTERHPQCGGPCARRAAVSKIGGCVEGRILRSSLSRLLRHLNAKGTTAMMKVSQCLWFEKDMEAALRFYTSLIPGSSIRWTSAVPADNPSGPAGSVRLAAFTIGDQRYMAIQGGPLDP